MTSKIGSNVEGWLLILIACVLGAVVLVPARLMAWGGPAQSRPTQSWLVGATVGLGPRDDSVSFGAIGEWQLTPFSEFSESGRSFTWLGMYTRLGLLAHRSAGAWDGPQAVEPEAAAFYENEWATWVRHVRPGPLSARPEVGLLLLPMSTYGAWDVVQAQVGYALPLYLPAVKFGSHDLTARVAVSQRLDRGTGWGASVELSIPLYTYGAGAWTAFDWAPRTTSQGTETWVPPWSVAVTLFFRWDVNEKLDSDGATTHVVDDH